MHSESQAASSFYVDQKPRTNIPSKDQNLEFHDSDDSDNDVSDTKLDNHKGDYSTRMGELFDDGEDDSKLGPEGDYDDDDDDDNEGFVYMGADAPDISMDYRDQLRDVLGQDMEDDQETDGFNEPLSLGATAEKIILHDDEPLQHAEILSDNTPSTSSISPTTPPSRTTSPATFNGSLTKLARPFLHPTVSRLRSYTPRSSQMISNGNTTVLYSHLFNGISPSPSHFSSISRVSSFSNLQSSASPKGGGMKRVINPTAPEVFKLTELHGITHSIYSGQSSKASSLLGTTPFGSPTVLSANGLICLGMDDGKIRVYDFKQTLKCVCGSENVTSVGPVTSIALSYDHTFVASGHATGYVQLFDLKSPQTPARFVAPITLATVTSGRKEGHLQGSRIISVGFVAGRHTAIVSADEYGLAFYHTLSTVLFVEASDILRILGRYPDQPPQPASSTSSKTLPTSNVRRRRSRYTVLGMAPLPLGTIPHASDAYNVIALLTPTKLVAVGLKPTPKTWFKCQREDEGGTWRSKSKWKGTIAWFPSVLRSSTSGTEALQAGQSYNGIPTEPMLVYTWGNSLNIIRVTETKIKQLRKTKSGKSTEVEIGTVDYAHVGRWSAEDDIHVTQWLNPNQIVLFTSTMLGVLDIHDLKLVEQIRFDVTSLLSPTLSYTVNGQASYADSVNEVAHSVRVYKGKIFLLGRERLQVGTLLTWADRILAFVECGDFMSAIDLTRSYYVGEAPGNRNGLPDNLEQRKKIIGAKLQDLMSASARYAFSEDRMTDETHVTPDGRGVDRTFLFEGLVTVCCCACVALDDFDFLFEDLFQQYDDSGISSIFLRQLEPFVLENKIRHIPPRVTKGLVALHEADERPDLAERIIWHIDPTCLDIDQAIALCRKHHLYDALIYVYTRALHDYVAPVVELLGLIRHIQRYRKAKSDALADAGDFVNDDSNMESIIVNAYKIYPYLSNLLSGLTYPSEEPLDEEEAFQAKKDVYTFLFFGRSSVWPHGEDGKVVLTSEEEGGVEPTYPYARQLLRFDSEPFLHSLDIAFEDVYLNGKSRSINRLMIVRILLEIVSSGDMPSEDITFVNIFIARNVPKYPQFLEFAPNTLHNILIDLAEDPDPNTREDRQLAAEYLLSVYNPHESDRIIQLFEAAGFYRILRSWYRHEQRWQPLLSTYIEDQSLHSDELFENIDEVLIKSARGNKGILPIELTAIISSSLGQLLQKDIARTATLLEKHTPELHERAMEAFNDDSEVESKHFQYLRHLLGPLLPDDEMDTSSRPDSRPSTHLPMYLRHMYLTLQCRYDPKSVIAILQNLPSNFLDWNQVLEICEEAEVYNAVVWAMNWIGNPQNALQKAAELQKTLALRIVNLLTAEVSCEDSQGHVDLDHDVEALETIGREGVAICLEHSQGFSVSEVPLEDIWFALLSSQINCVQIISACQPSNTKNLKDSALTTIRSLVQATFGALVSITSTRAVSFSQLFKRLVDSAPTSTGTHYTEFRAVLTGMLESYRSDGDMLIMTKHLVERDLFDVIAKLTSERTRGWAPSRGVCTYCSRPLIEKKDFTHSENNAVPLHPIIVSGTGIIFHSKCLPSGS